MNPADELRAAAAQLREMAYGFAADDFYRDDVARAAEKGIFSAPATLWARLMSPAMAKPIAAWLEAEADCQEAMAIGIDVLPRLIDAIAGKPTGLEVTPSLDTGPQALAFARAITDALEPKL
jgi:soluble lytic murein transglycosylase-like protein